MLVVENNTTFFNWGIGGTVKPLEYGGEVVVVFDPSKTNMAMVIGTPRGDIITTFEFSGNNRKRGPAMDTTQYCMEVREFLSKLFQNVNLYTVAIEQAILKKGNNYYHSSMVLTEIRSNLLNFFIEHFGIRVLEINNWSWKSHVLPQGYRSQSEKGSKRYYLTYFPDSPYSHYFEADMTDCLCIFKYVIDNFCSNYTMFCNRVETCIVQTECWYCPSTTPLENSMPAVTFNDRYSIKDNLSYYTNRLTKPFVMKVPLELVELSDIYGHVSGFSLDNCDDEFVKVVCKRAC